MGYTGKPLGGGGITKIIGKRMNNEHLVRFKRISQCKPEQVDQITVQQPLQ